MARTNEYKNKKNKKRDLDADLQAEGLDLEQIDAHNSDRSDYGYPSMDVEPFVPTDVFPSTHVRGKRGRTRKKKRALWAALIALGVVLLSVGGVLAYFLMLNPSAQFADNTQQNPTEVITVDNSGETPTPAIGEPTPTPTLDPYEVVSAQADTSMMQNIVNVMLIGVDYAQERETWSGKHEYHSDVMIIMAINFDENRVDLISLPRDTYAKIPGVKGIYKLNASINCGGGFEAEGGAGFLKTCEAASWMLGGIPINYYYAVTMPAVKELVNAIGGVDYNLELDFSMAGRNYSAGPTHLNGQGVLDYLRVRKNVDKGGDLNRINRQKEMLIAIFESMQKQNLILKAPEIISSFNGQLYTNCTLGQTAALTKFAYSLDKDNIGMYSMDGTMDYGIFNWNFCLTDQSKRVKIIQDVYGVTVPKELEYTADYANYRYADIVATHYLEITQPLVDYVSQALAEDDLLPTMSPEPTVTPDVFTQTPEVTQSPTAEPTSTATPTPTPTATPTPTEAATTEGTSSKTTNSFSVVRLNAQSPIQNEEYRRYSQFSRDLFSNFLTSLDELEEAQAIARKEASKYAAGKSNDLKAAAQDVSDYASHVKTNALDLAAEFGYSTSNFAWTYWYDKDPNFNAIRVDFR